FSISITLSCKCLPLYLEKRGHVDEANIFSFNIRPVGVSANPPSPVSRRLDGICLPMRHIAPITSSHGTVLVIPASAMSADTMANAEPAEIGRASGRERV